MNLFTPRRQPTLSLAFLLVAALSTPATAWATTHTNSFEAGLEGWTPVEETSLYDWARASNGTSSRYTGPANAHDGDYFVYLETSYGNTPEKIAYLESPTFSGEYILEVTFHYHLYGSQMGRLALQTFDGEEWEDFWEIQGQQHGNHNAAWTEKRLDLSRQNAQQIRFVGVTGTGYKGDMSIDKVVFKTGIPAASVSLWSQSGSNVYYEHPDGGNVGIGTDSPTADLDILGNLSRPLTGHVSMAPGGVQVTGSGTLFTEELNEGDSLLMGGQSFLVTEITSDTALTVDVPHALGAEEVTAYTDSDLLSIQTGAEEQVLVVNRAGNVGIGTAAPVAKLDVAGGIRVGFDAICDEEREGTIRYDDAGQAVEFCNGAAWAQVEGPMGKSAYQVWLDAGNSGTEANFIASLRGGKGDTGEPGAPGVPGIAGQDGSDGLDGQSAYEIWLEAGNTGSEAEFVAALKGEKGDKGDPGTAGDSQSSLLQLTPLSTTPPNPTLGDIYANSSGAICAHVGGIWTRIIGNGICTLDIYSPESNIAKNASRTGYPTITESDDGWGGATDKWGIVDGIRSYEAWQNGLGFTGGEQGWAGESAGWRHAIIDFGEEKDFSRVIVWHFRALDIPSVVKLSYWDQDQSNWVEILSSDNAHDYLIYPIENTGSYWPEGVLSIVYPMAFDFQNVTSQKLRFSLDNTPVEGNPYIEHGWIFEIEVY